MKSAKATAPTVPPTATTAAPNPASTSYDPTAPPTTATAPPPPPAHHYRFYPGTGGGSTRHRINVPLRPGLCDEEFILLFEAVVSEAISRFDPDAIVLQSGADSLAGDFLAGNEGYNLTIPAHAHCHEVLLSYRKPLLVLGGGGYNPDLAAHCWAYETAVLQGRPDAAIRLLGGKNAGNGMDTGTGLSAAAASKGSVSSGGGGVGGLSGSGGSGSFGSTGLVAGAAGSGGVSQQLVSSAPYEASRLGHGHGHANIHGVSGGGAASLSAMGGVVAAALQRPHIPDQNTHLGELTQSTLAALKQ